MVIEFRRAKVVDHSTLAECYELAGTRLHLRHSSPDYLEVLDKVKGMIDVNVTEDPNDHVADNQLA